MNAAAPEMRSLLEEQLRHNVTQIRHNHISSGIVGALYVLYQLTEQGDSDIAYAMAAQEDYPGLSSGLKLSAT